MGPEGDRSHALYQFSRNIRVLETQRSEIYRGTPADTLDYVFIKSLFQGYRGGIATSLVTPESSINIPFSSDFERKSGFTTDQKKYARKTLAFLNSFMRGTPIAGVSHGAPLSERIQNQLTDPNNTSSFEDAMVNGYLNGLKDFIFAYPKLSPVLRAIYGSGGTKATLKAIHHGADFLKDANRGDLTETNKRTFKALPSTAFLKRHVRKKNGKRELDFEIHCAGQALALTVINQAKEAALRISDASLYVPTNSPFDYSEIHYTRMFKTRMENIEKEVEKRFQATS